jgi:hypothetical protein
VAVASKEEREEGKQAAGGTSSIFLFCDEYNQQI